MKENKHFTVLTFSIPFIYVSVLGLFFHDNSSGVNYISSNSSFMSKLKTF